MIDTHTAVAAAVYDRYREETGDETPTVIASTASPFKFVRSVMTAIDPAYGGADWTTSPWWTSFPESQTYRFPRRWRSLETRPCFMIRSVKRTEWSPW